MKVSVGKVSTALCISLLLSAPDVPGGAAAGERVPKWIEPTDELVTPHITWKKPAAAGPLKVLCITYRMGMREIIELAQRFDLDWSVFATETQDSFVSTDYQTKWFAGTSQEAMETRLREKLARDYDCIVVGNIKWDILPEWARAAIIAKVDAGTGLAGYLWERFPDLSYRDKQFDEAIEHKLDVDARSVVGAFPWEGMPAFRQYASFDSFASSCVYFAESGQGRVALLQGYRCPFLQMMTPEIVDRFPGVARVHYDYYLALAIRLMEWVARREPPVRVLPPSGTRLAVDRSGLRRIEFLVDSVESLVVSAEFALRDARTGDVVGMGKKPLSLSKGRNRVPWPVTGVPAGHYFADIWLETDAKTLAFGSRFIEVVSTSHVAGLELKAVAFDRGDRIAGAVSVAAPRQGQTLEIGWWDTHGRCVARAEASLKESEEETVPFTFGNDRPLTIMNRIEVRLRAGLEVLDVDDKPFFFRNLYYPSDEVRFCSWAWNGHKPDSYLVATVNAQLRRAGFDTVLSHSPYDLKENTVGLAAAANLNGGVFQGPMGFMMPRARGVRATAAGEERYYCLSDPAQKERARKLWTQVANTVDTYSARVFMSGDEICLVPHGSEADVCFSTHCRADLPRYLTTVYADLDELNREYGADYKTWDEIQPINLDTAVRTRQIPRWIDHRRHMDSVWADFTKLAGDAIAKVTPKALSGYGGSNDPGHMPKTDALGGADYYKLGRIMSFNGAYYYPMQVDALRDFSAPGTLISGGYFAGYRQVWRGGRDPVHNDWWAWNGILRGANSIWPFVVGSHSMGCSFMAPDLTFLDHFKTTIEQVRIIKSGIGKLLLNAKRPDDGIAVLYSIPSMYLTTFVPNMPRFWDCPAATSILFPEAGFQFRLVAAEQVDQGMLGEGAFRALYLPYAQAISLKGVREILAFAENGGLVVADLRPAVADDHGKPYAEGALDELFGIRQDTREPDPAPESEPVLAAKFGDLEGALPSTHADLSVRLAGGKALATIEQAPALIVNDYGMGKGILLNMSIGDYMEYIEMPCIRFKDEAVAATAQSLLRQCLAMGRIEPAVTISPYVPGCHAWRFENGGVLVLGLLWDAPAFLPGNLHVSTLQDAHAEKAKETRDIVLRLPRKAHTYDMLAGKYLGFARDIERTVRPGRPHMLSALPYEVTGLALRSDEEVGQGAVLSFEIRLRMQPGGHEAGMHILRVEFTDPEGDPVAHYAANARADKGIYRGRLPLCLNEKPGTWRLHVRDVATGVRGEADFSVLAVE